MAFVHEPPALCDLYADADTFSCLDPIKDGPVLVLPLLVPVVPDAWLLRVASSCSVSGGEVMTTVTSPAGPCIRAAAPLIPFASAVLAPLVSGPLVSGQVAAPLLASGGVPDNWLSKALSPACAEARRLFLRTTRKAIRPASRAAPAAPPTAAPMMSPRLVLFSSD